jgi:hypothetical protein
VGLGSCLCLRLITSYSADTHGFCLVEGADMDLSLYSQERFQLLVDEHHAWVWALLEYEPVGVRLSSLLGCFVSRD